MGLSATEADIKWKPTYIDFDLEWWIAWLRALEILSRLASQIR
jgi:hypothetical protein